MNTIANTAIITGTLALLLALVAYLLIGRRLKRY